MEDEEFVINFYFSPKKFLIPKIFFFDNISNNFYIKVFKVLTLNNKRKMN